MIQWPTLMHSHAPCVALVGDQVRSRDLQNDSQTAFKIFFSSFSFVSTNQISTPFKRNLNLKMWTFQVSFKYFSVFNKP
jgi:hypothetical protein